MTNTNNEIPFSATPEYLTEAESLVESVRRFAYTTPHMGSAYVMTKDEQSAKETLVIAREALKTVAARLIEAEARINELEREKKIVQAYFRGES